MSIWREELLRAYQEFDNTIEEITGVSRHDRMTLGRRKYIVSSDTDNVEVE